MQGNRGRILIAMAITKYTFFSPDGNDFPVTADADAKLYMMLTGMNYNEFRLKHWTPVLNTALNRIYTKTSIVLGGRYFELKDHSITLSPVQTNFIHAVIDLSNTTEPVTITVEQSDTSNNIDINNNSGVLKRCFDIVETSGSGVTSSRTPKGQTTEVVDLNTSGVMTMGKTATLQQSTGFGRTATLTRIGNLVTIYSENRHSSNVPNGWNRNVATLPVGWRPIANTMLWQRDLLDVSKYTWLLFRSNGQVDLSSVGDITTTSYIISNASFYITNDPFPQ